MHSMQLKFHTEQREFPFLGTLRPSDHLGHSKSKLEMRKRATRGTTTQVVSCATGQERVHVNSPSIC